MPVARTNSWQIGIVASYFEPHQRKASAQRKNHFRCAKLTDDVLFKTRFPKRGPNTPNQLQCLELPWKILIENTKLAWRSLIVRPCEKVIGFFQNKTWSRLLNINTKVKKLKSAKYINAIIGRGQVINYWKQHDWCQLCDVKFGHRIMEATGLFDYKMHNFTPNTLISQTGEARMLFNDFLISIWISDIFVCYI